MTSVYFCAIDIDIISIVVYNSIIRRNKMSGHFDEDDLRYMCKEIKQGGRR